MQVISVKNALFKKYSFVYVGISLLQERYAFTICENATNNTLIGTITPTVPNLELLPTPTSIKFDSLTGEIRVRPGLDYENIPQLTFSIVTTSNPIIILGTLVVYVNNIVDVSPLLPQTTYNIDLPIDTPANNAVWCIPALIQSEEDAVVTYSLSTPLFAVDTDGVIVLTESIVEDTPGKIINLTLSLTDRTQNTDVTLNFILTTSNPPLRKLQYLLRWCSVYRALM